MATYLYRIGKFAYRRKGAVLSVWLIILVLMGVGAATLSGPTKDSFSIPGTPAQQAQDLMAERFPDAPNPMDSLSARYVVQAPAGTTLADPANVKAMDDMLASIRGIDKVADSAKVDPATATPEQAAKALVNPVTGNDSMVAMFKEKAAAAGTSETQAVDDARALSPLSADGTVGYVEVPFSGDFADLDQALRDSINSAADVGRAEGLNVQVSGSAAQEAEMPGGVTELIGIAVAAVVLAITFGSLVAAGLPLLTAIIGIAIGSLGITVATGFMDLSSMTPTLAIMIGLAVAIDYSLFIMSRFRHELTLTDNRAEAAGRAVGTAGSAVVFAGLTVIIALVALRVVGIPFLSDMGAAAAFTVLIAVLIALTLLPAILGMFGRKAFAGKIPFLSKRAEESENDDSGKPKLALRFITAVVRRPTRAADRWSSPSGRIGSPATGLSLALPSEATGDPATSARQAYDLIDEGFGDGRNGPLIAIVDAKDASVPAGEAFAEVVSTISSFGDVQNAQVVGVNEAGDTAQVLITPKSGPTDPATMDLVGSLRGAEARTQRFDRRQLRHHRSDRTRRRRLGHA